MDTISNEVRFFRSEHVDAPILSGTPGALVALLDACLVNGYGPATINSLTVEGEIASALISSGNNYDVGDVIRVAGAAPAALNSDWRVQEKAGNTIRWSVAGLGVPDGTATGTISAKRAPAGWQKVFADGDRAAYRSLSHAEHNGLYLYVDDSGTTAAKVRGYESMTDIDNGVGPFPLPVAPQLPDGFYWAKAQDTNGVRRWALAADGKRIVYCPAYHASYTLRATGLHFGKLINAAPDDVWATSLNGMYDQRTAIEAYPGYNGNVIINASNYGNISQCVQVLARSLAGIGSPLSNRILPNGNSGDSGVYPVTSVSLPYWGIDPLIKEYPSNYGRGGFGCMRYLATSPNFTEITGFQLIGVPGNGAMLIEAGGNTARHSWLLDLGTNGRWD